MQCGTQGKWQRGKGGGYAPPNNLYLSKYPHHVPLKELEVHGWCWGVSCGFSPTPLTGQDKAQGWVQLPSLIADPPSKHGGRTDTAGKEVTTCNTCHDDHFQLKRNFSDLNLFSLTEEILLY